MITKTFPTQQTSPLLMNLFLIATIIITVNSLIGMFSRISIAADEIIFLDTLWRVVVGQRVGIDFRNAFGIGPYQLAALLWPWLGPHNYVMWLTIALINLSITFLGCIVAARTLAHKANLAWLFCITLAFELSAPAEYNGATIQVGIAGFYDRHMMSALAILFLQTFGRVPISSKRENAIEVAIPACLLNIMFLTKISGFLLGVMILIAGCLLRGRTAHRLKSLCGALLAFAAIAAIEFKAAGLEFLPVIRDYEVAAHARVAYSFYDLGMGMIIGMVSWPLGTSVTLLVLFSVSQRLEELRLEFRCIGLVIATYTACQFALNITNGGTSMWLAPAAIASLAVCKGAKPAARREDEPEYWWRRFAPPRLAEFSAREAISITTFVLVLVPQIMCSMVVAIIGALISLGILVPNIVTAGKGVSVRSLHLDSVGAYERSLNEAVTVISSLNLSHEAIVNLDLANPFPVLFLATPPRGIQVWWHFGVNVPEGARLEWQDVVGDACVVTIPGKPYFEDTTARLADVVRPKLASDFHLVYQDASWSIYRRTRDCASAPR